MQEVMLDTYRVFDRFQGDNARVWFLRIVHQTCYRRLEKSHPLELMSEVEEGLHQRYAPTPEVLPSQNNDRQRVLRTLESLPVQFREMILLREVEGCSYKEIAEITGRPIASVPSILCQARERLERRSTTYAAAHD